MRAREFIVEKKLERGDFYKPDRLANFISKMSQGLPFKKVDGSDVILFNDPNLLAILNQEIDYVSKSNLPSIPNRLKDNDGQDISLSQLEKTSEFGGSEKEKFKIKPSDLTNLSGTGPSTKVDLENNAAVKNILEKDAFLAGELANRIMTDPILTTQGGKLGRAIIDIAGQIDSGNLPTFPSDLSKSEISALRDYAGEYLGVLQMIKGIAIFPNSESFYEHLGTNDLESLKLYFPKATSTPLADSIGASDRGIAAVEGPQGTVMKISSKGDKIGAPPSLDNLNPKTVEDKEWAREVVGFIEIAKKSNAAEQPFKLLNYLINLDAKNIQNIDKVIRTLLPFSDNDITAILNSDEVYSKKAEKIASLAYTSKGTTFGKCHYLINKQVLSLVNKHDALPNLKKVILEILGSNFIQVYSQIKGNNLTAYVLWPNKVSGDVYLYSKAYADDPRKGKLSFYVSTSSNKSSSEPDDEVDHLKKLSSNIKLSKKKTTRIPGTNKSLDPTGIRSRR